jgi:asparagine synthase (glutamine-hydrolysing)
MSAIGVIFNRDGAPVNSEMLIALGNGLDRLGPDGGNELIASSIGMSYRAFHTTSESHSERQPVVSPLDNILVMDGIVFNRQELIELLRDELRNDRTDVGILSVGLDKYGVDFLAKVTGNFALAWWQPQTQTLTLARDPFGVRMLFYYYDKNRVIAASDLRSLLEVVGETLEIDEEYVAGYLAVFPEPKRTPYKNFHAVEPGYFINIKNGKLEARRHWGPDPNKEIRYRTDAEYEEHLRHILYEGVQYCLRTDERPIWSSLSGGFDSSSIVCIADDLIANGKAEASELETFSIVFGEAATADERRFIRAVEEKRGKPGFHLQQDEYWLRFSPPEESFLFLPSPHLCTPGEGQKLREMIGKSGVRVILDGHGGDHVFWNLLDASPELTDLLIRGNLLGLHSRLRVWSREFKSHYLQILWKQAVLPLLPRAIRARYEPKVEMAKWFDLQFIKRTNLSERMILPPDPFGFHSLGGKMQAGFLLQVIWLVAAGIYTFREGAEMRYPLLYRPLIEFLLAIPFDQKLRPGESRSLMRRALRNTLPEKILRRRGKGATEEALNRGLYREWRRLEKLFMDSRACDLGYIDAEELQLTLRRALHGGKLDMGALLYTISLEIWLRSIECHAITIKGGANHNKSTSPQPVMAYSADITM